MKIDMSRFRATFFVEAAEHLEHMEAALLQLEHAPEDGELLNTIFRAAHSIKGASTTFGVEEVGKFTHVLENLLDRLRDGKMTATSQLVELLLTSVDVIEGLIAAAKDGAPPPENLAQVFAELQKANTDQPATTTSVPTEAALPQPSITKSKTYQVTLRPSKDFFRFGQDPLLLLREIADLGTTSHLVVDRSKLPPFAELDVENCYLSWSLELTTEKPVQSINDVFLFLDGDSYYEVSEKLPGQTTETNVPPSEPSVITPEAKVAPQVSAAAVVPPAEMPANTSAVSTAKASTPAKAAPANKSSGAENETVRVDRCRLDELINQIGELVIGSSMVEQELRQRLNGVESAAMNQLAKIVRDLQEMSLSLRMVPIAGTFQKMARVIRDLGRKLNKQIDFITEGDDTELDKSVVDQIGDPLVHMVRNAADHGIETTEERIAAGKSPTGKVTLRAFQQGGNIFIEIEDDGRGLNRQKLVEKAIERGIISASDHLSDTEICNLIFHPGFSTAAQITDVSGRGVGMDVVRRNVEALQGSVTIRSVFGKGSTITVRLPLTLAILDGLLVGLDNETYVVPLLSVVESIRIETKEIRQVVGAGEVILLRGEVVPLVRLDRVLKTNSENDEQSGLLVIVEDQGKRFALMVDELLGQQQVVLKNLETNFCKVPGVAAATILGDGRVALILDIFGVAAMHGQRGVRASGYLNAAACEVSHVVNA